MPWCCGNCEGCRHTDLCATSPGTARLHIRSPGFQSWWAISVLVIESSCAWFVLTNDIGEWFYTRFSPLQFIRKVCQDINDHVKRGAFGISLIKVCNQQELVKRGYHWPKVSSETSQNGATHSGNVKIRSVMQMHALGLYSLFIRSAKAPCLERKKLLWTLRGTLFREAPSN